MPGEMSKTASKRKRPSFSPPRPQTSKSTSTKRKLKTRANNTPTAIATQKRISSPQPSPTPSPSEPASAANSPQSSLSPTSEPEYILAEITENDPEKAKAPVIPLPLVHQLMNHHFQDKGNTRLTTDAKEVLGRYLETFVREAIMRSIYEAQKKDSDVEGNGDVQGDDGWLEVEDLERMAPQLVLDF